MDIVPAALPVGDDPAMEEVGVVVGDTDLIPIYLFRPDRVFDDGGTDGGVWVVVDRIDNTPMTASTARQLIDQLSAAAARATG